MTKFNIKTLMVAVALAAAGSQANAAMVTAQGTLGDGNSSVMLFAWSSALGRSYTRDLGFKLNDFLPTGTVAPAPGNYPFNPVTNNSSDLPIAAGNAALPNYSLNFAPDSVMTSWLGNGTTLAPDVQWGVAAVDGTGSGANFRALTTVAVGAPSAGTTNSELATFEVKFDTVVAVHNQLGTHFNNLGPNNGVDTTIGNGSAGTNPDTVLAAQDVPAQIGLNWGGATSFFVAANAGQSLEMFFMAQNGTLGSTNATALRYGAGNPDGPALWTLDTIGGLGYATTPVPIPAAAWLFGSGLVGLVGIARRKSKLA